MRNIRLDVALHNEQGQFLCAIDPNKAQRLIDSGVARPMVRRPGKRHLLASVALNAPPPPPSNSSVSPTTITFADMLAAVGIPMRHDEWLSRARIETARDKIAC